MSFNVDKCRGRNNDNFQYKGTNRVLQAVTEKKEHKNNNMKPLNNAQLQ